MKWLKENKAELQLIIATVLMLFGCILTMMGFWVAPTGVIHNSVIWIMGQILAFSGAVFGIDYHYKAIIDKHRRKD